MIRGLLAFFGTAVISGIIFHTIFLLYFNHSSTIIPSISHLQPSSWPDNPSKYLTATVDAPAPTATVFKDPWVGVNDMTLEQIGEMVSKTKGFFARDFSLGLGWNNVSGPVSCNISILFIMCVQVRFILEAALLHATMLNRTLVIPSFIYTRSCEFDM
jgi:hypothetical protein